MSRCLTVCCLLVACGGESPTDAGLDAGLDAGIDAAVGPYAGREWPCDDPSLWAAEPSVEGRLEVEEDSGCGPTTLPIGRFGLGVVPRTTGPVRGACFRVATASPASTGLIAGTAWASHRDGRGELFAQRPYDEVVIEARGWTEDGHLVAVRGELPPDRAPELIAEGVADLVAVLASGTYATRRSVHPVGGAAVATSADVVALAETFGSLGWIESAALGVELVVYDPESDAETLRRPLATASRAHLVARVDGFDVVVDERLLQLRDGAVRELTLERPVDSAFEHQDQLFTRVGDELRRHDDDGAVAARATIPGLRDVFANDYDLIWLDTDGGLTALDHDLEAAARGTVSLPDEVRASLGRIVEAVPDGEIAWGELGFAHLGQSDPDAPGPRWLAAPVAHVGGSFRPERVVAWSSPGEPARIERVLTEGVCL